MNKSENIRSERASDFSTDDVLVILRNVGVDTSCGACMCQAFTGSNGYEHTCGKPNDVVVTLERS
jgi:hypothetical protein